jgi:N-glycosylase/DNA lyase
MGKEKRLLAGLRGLKESPLAGKAGARLKEFKETGKGGPDRIFSELCFCILTANFNAERAIAIQEKLAPAFLRLPEKELAARLREAGHRFPNARAAYIAAARKRKKEIAEKIISVKDSAELREWLVRNVKGLGYKEASHFLRNTGRKDIAVIDFHIVDLLAGRGLIEKPKSMTRARYLKTEELLKRIAEKAGMNLAELDLCLWYLETGRLLK